MEAGALPKPLMSQNHWENDGMKKWFTHFCWHENGTCMQKHQILRLTDQTTVLNPVRSSGPKGRKGSGEAKPGKFNLTSTLGMADGNQPHRFKDENKAGYLAELGLFTVQTCPPEFTVARQQQRKEQNNYNSCIGHFELKIPFMARLSTTRCCQSRTKLLYLGRKAFSCFNIWTSKRVKLKSKWSCSLTSDTIYPVDWTPIDTLLELGSPVWWFRVHYKTGKTFPSLSMEKQKIAKVCTSRAITQV